MITFLVRFSIVKSLVKIPNDIYFKQMFYKK